MRSLIFSRGSALGAALVLVLGLLGFSPAAHAATGVIDLQATSATVTAGEPVELTWTSVDVANLEATGVWTGPRPEAGTESIADLAVGTHTFTLSGTDVATAEPITASIDVVVEPAPAPPEPIVVTPLPVSLDSECLVQVPAVEGVTYLRELDGETVELEPGAHEAIDFVGDEDVAVITAIVAEGFELAPDAVAEWTIGFEEVLDCMLEPSDDLVTATSGCSAVTFTNVSDLEMLLLYGDEDEEEADGDFTLAPGATQTVETSRALLDFVAVGTDELAFQFDQVAVDQDCGATPPAPSAPQTGKAWPAKHPRVAPAAGVR